MRHAAPVVFPVDLDGDEHVYRVHHINVQRKNTDVIPVQKVLTITSHVTSCIVMLKDVIKVSLPFVFFPLPIVLPVLLRFLCSVL